MTAPTEKQRLVLAAVAALAEATGLPPTRQELADALGLSSIGSLHDMLLRLVRGGWLSVPARRHRAMRLTAAGVEAARELLGRAG